MSADQTHHKPLDMVLAETLPALGICLHNQLAIRCPVHLLKQWCHIGGSALVSVVGSLNSQQ